MANHYTVLGLSANGQREDGTPYSQDEIKKAHKKQALKYHPDKNPEDKEDAKIQFQKIQEAYKCLSDPQQRKTYDATLNADSKHLFVVFDKKEIDLTQSIANAKIPIQTILNTAKKNPALAHEILLNTSTLDLIPLVKQFELLFIACTQFDPTELINDYLGRDIISAAALFVEDQGKSNAVAFCTACLLSRNYFDIAQKFFKPILEKLPNEHLLRLCSVYPEAAIYLFQNHRTTPLRLNEFYFILNHHPRERQKLVAQAPESLQQQVKLFKTLQRSIDWNSADLTVDALLPYQEQLQTLGYQALSLSENKLAQIKILKLLIGENPTAFWQTLEQPEQDNLQALIIADVVFSYEQTTKDGYFDSSLILSHNGKALLLDKLPLDAALTLLARFFKLDRCNPINIPDYIKLILSPLASVPSDSEYDASSEPVLKLTYNSTHEPEFLCLLKEDNVIAFVCLAKERELFLATIALAAYGPSSFKNTRALQRLAYLYFQHNVTPIPESLKTQYEAVTELHKYISKTKNAEPPKDDINNDNNAPQRIPTIEETEFFRLFTLSGFFYELLLIKTTSMDIKLCLIENIFSELNEKNEVLGESFEALQNDDNITKFIVSVLTEGTDQHVSRLVNLLSGKNVRFVSSYLNHTMRDLPPIIAEDEYFIKMLILNRLLAHDSAFTDKVISYKALIDLDSTFKFNKEFLLVLVQKLLEDLDDSYQLITILGGAVNAYRIFKLLGKAGEFPKDKFDIDALLPQENEEEKDDVQEDENVYKDHIVRIARNAGSFLKKYPKYTFKAPFAWHTVTILKWCGNKINAGLELLKMYEHLYTHPSDDNTLSLLIALLKRTHIDNKTLVDLAIVLKFTHHTSLWKALLYLMHNTQEFIIFEDARKTLQEPGYTLQNAHYELEAQFPRIAEFTLRAEEGKTSPEAVAIMLNTHGEKIVPLLEELQLVTQHQRHQDLLETFDSISQQQGKFKTQAVDTDKITQKLLDGFNALVKTCPDNFLCNSVPAQTLFEDISNAIKKYDITSPVLTALYETYPKNDKKNLLLWVANATRRDELKVLLGIKLVNQFPKKLLNSLLSNETTLAIIADEFIESIDDLLPLLDHLTRSSRDKIATYVLQKYGTRHRLIQKFLSDIKSSVKKLTVADVFSPVAFSHSLCEAYAKESDLVKAEFHLIAAKLAEQNPVLSGSVAELNGWATLPYEYKHIRTDFSEQFSHAEDDDARRIFAEDYKARYIALSQDHQRLMQEQKQILATITLLNEHVTDLDTKEIKASVDRDKETVAKYKHRIAAVRNLATDLENLSHNYYKTDFSAVAPDNNQFHNTLSQKIKEHLDAKDSVLKEHTGSRQVVYDVLAALTWILLPFSIYKAVTHKTLFYFHAENSTEKFLSEKIKPQLRTTLALAE
ncbi:MAG: J domain-containing protein [Gammaproteobacteria bacterium]|nr:J domain-containing protein [Gammaproteobacteria bacterium]